MRVALFTPLNPVQSALCDIIEGVLPHLAEQFDLTVVTKGNYQPSHPIFQMGARPYIPCISYQKFQRRADDFDLIVYNLGDDGDAHEFSFDALHRYPGLVLLNDLVMQHAMVHLTIGRGNHNAYVNEMRYSYGEDGERLANIIISRGGEEFYPRYPLVERVLDDSLAAVGFNEYMCEQMRRMCPGLPVRRILYQFYLPPGFPPDFDGPAFRRELGLVNSPVLASFGIFVPDKRLGLVLRTFKRLLQRHPDAIYLLVGGHNEHFDLPGQFRALGLEGKVRLTGWKPPAEFVKYMHAVDVALHLRYPHVGGTPYTPIRLLGMGIPTIISDIEPLAELPTDGVVRINPEQLDEAGMILAAMDYLLTHRDVARAIGENGRQYIAKNHNVELIASQYADFFREVVAHRETLEKEMRRRRSKGKATSTWACTSASSVHVVGATLTDMGVNAASNRLLTPVAEALQSLKSE